MKIEKLYTLSQFVELVQTQINPNLKNYEDHSCAWAFDRIWYYNDFLKQPLKKEMFVNDFNPRDYISVPIHPDQQGDEEPYLKEQFEIAEKKVIFKGWSVNNHLGISNIDMGYCIKFIESSEYLYLDCLCNSETIVIKTPHDLAEVTNGELETINLEL